MAGYALSAGGPYLRMVVVDLVNKAENYSFINDEYFDYYRIYKCLLVSVQSSLHRVYIKTNCLSNRKFERLGGSLDEIVTVFVHKYNVIMPRPIKM